MKRRYWALPLIYLALVALFLLYGINFDASVGVFVGTGAAIALSLPFLLAAGVALFFVGFVDVALLSLVLSIAVTLITAPGRAEYRRALGLSVGGNQQLVVQVISSFLAFLVVLSLIRLGLALFKAGKD